VETIMTGLVGAAIVVLLVGIALFLYGEERKATELGRRSVGAIPVSGGLRVRPNRAPAEPERLSRPVEFIPKPLPSVDAARFSDEWRKVQKAAINDPKGAIADADKLAGEVMRARGYGTPAFKQSGGVAEEHPAVAVNYRRAHVIARANERGAAGAEELRRALIHYHALFAELLNSEEPVLTHA
jgi:hypothetical protein